MTLGETARRWPPEMDRRVKNLSNDPPKNLPKLPKLPRQPSVLNLPSNTGPFDFHIRLHPTSTL